MNVFFVNLCMEIEEIYQFFYSEGKLRQNNNEKFLRDIENYLTIIESEDNIYFDRLNYDYAISLVDNEEYSRALPLIKHCLTKIKKENYQNNLIDIESYTKSLEFNTARSLYFTKKLNESKIIFSELHEKYPNNDIYKNWLKSSIHWKYQQTINILWIISAFAIGINSISNWFKLKIWGDISISITIICLLLIPTLILISKQQQKKVVQTNNKLKP